MNKKSLGLLALVLLLSFAFGVAAWRGYNILYGQIQLLKSDVDNLKEFIPPVFSPGHVDIRKHAGLDQIRQADESFVLVIGDSIVERMNLLTLSGAPVINAGMGGGSAVHVSQFLAEMQPGATVKGILIAVGVNDAIQSPDSSAYLTNFRNYLKQSVTLSKRLSGKNVAISTIIPIEKGKILGDNYFDQNKIDKINDFIVDFCLESNTLIVNQSPSFIDLTSSNISYTTDGVHLNVIGYRVMRDNIHQAISW